ncbi:HD domain-containing protein [Rhizobacter fulvus]
MPTWQAPFKRLQDATAEDVQRLMAHDIAVARALPDRVLAHLKLLDGDAGGWPVNRYVHSLLAATLALEDGQNEEYVVCALLHDIGDTLGSYNHADLAAALLEPFVGEANLWMIRHHGIVQDYHFFHHIGLSRDLRDRLRRHPHYDRTVEFVDRYDNGAFDKSACVLPISEFEPMVRRVFAQPVRSLYLAALA